MKAKQFVALLLIFVLLLSACTPKEPATTEATSENTETTEAMQTETKAAGMGDATAKGYNGDVTVRVGLSGVDRIETLDVDHQETEGLGASAIDQLMKQAIEKQTYNLDTVSGATASSHAFIEALKGAIENAGGNVDAFATADEVEQKEDTELTYDVAVIGGGGAGFAAAISAKEAGVENVVILEKMPNVGGNTLISGAEYAAPGNDLQKKEGIEDSPELFAQDVEKAGGNQDLIKYMADHALETSQWMKDFVGIEWLDSLMFFGGHSVKRSLIPAGHSGVELITKYKAKAEEMGIDIFTEHDVKEILTTDGVVTGVLAKTPNNQVTVHAKAVIVASGGFGANKEMLYQNDNEVDEYVLSTNSPGATGDGIVMAQALGADVVDMDQIQLYPVCDVETGRLLYVGDTRLVGGALLVNKEGKRFVEELDTRRAISIAIKEQTDHVGYLVWDEKSSETTGTIHSYPQEAESLFERGLLVKADTLEELAAHFGVDEAALKETVENFNQNSKNQEDPEFNLRMLGWTIEEAPFYMLKTGPAVHHTMGGLKINTNAEVINTAGENIPGLYAAGEVTGGIHGSNRLGSAALSDISVFGRQAGQKAAEFIQGQ